MPVQYDKNLRHIEYPHTDQRPDQEQPAVEGVYGVVTGRYVDNGLTERLPNPDAPLSKTEWFIKKRLLARLHATTPDDPPVVGIDAGGGMGLSMLRVAKHLSKHIDRKRLVMAVTNVSRQPEDYLNGGVGEYMARRSPKMLALYQQQKRRVQFVSADFTADGMPELLHPDGGPLDLRGAVDVLHESWAVTAWTRYPATVIPRMGSLVSRQGVYFVNDFANGIVSAPGHDGEAVVRMAEIEQAHERLTTEYGLRKVTRVEAGEHAGTAMNCIIFAGPDAEPIAFG